MDARDPGDGRRALMILAAIGLLGLVMLGGVLIWLSQRADGGDGGSTAIGQTMRAAGCTYVSPKVPGRGHIQEGVRVKYNSDPGVGGNHYASPAPFNAYDAQVEQERLVHNLEHGGVIIQWGPKVPDATVTRIREYYLDDPNGMVIAPYPPLDDKIAISAWGRLAKCSEFDEGAVTAFQDEYRAKGPEPFRLEDLAPGR